MALNKVVLRLHFGKHPSKREHSQIYLELQFLKWDGPAREKLEQAPILGYMVTEGKGNPSSHLCPSFSSPRGALEKLPSLVNGLIPVNSLSGGMMASYITITGCVFSALWCTFQIHCLGASIIISILHKRKQAQESRWFVQGHTARYSQGSGHKTKLLLSISTKRQPVVAEVRSGFKFCPSTCKWCYLTWIGVVPYKGEVEGYEDFIK